MTHRLYCPIFMQSGMEIALPAHAARHAQVLRLQPGDAVELFHGGWAALQAAAGGANPSASAGSAGSAASARAGGGASATGAFAAGVSVADGLAEVAPPACTTGYFHATISHMGRSEVRAHIGEWHAPAKDSGVQVHIVCGMPANERMDWLVEKATELGVASIQPVLTARSVLRLSGERAHKRVAHWQAIAVAACEQSGRTVVPPVLPIVDLRAFLAQPAAQTPTPTRQTQPVQPAQQVCGLQEAGAHKWLLSLRPQSVAFEAVRAAIMQSGKATGVPMPVYFLSGPEGGLAEDEENTAIAQGWQPLSLGAHTLRAETAPLAVLAALGLSLQDLSLSSH